MDKELVWTGDDAESQIKEIEAELRYYEKKAKACREKAQLLILEAVKCEVSAGNRRKGIRQLREEVVDAQAD